MACEAFPLHKGKKKKKKKKRIEVIKETEKSKGAYNPKVGSGLPFCAILMRRMKEFPGG